VCVCVCVAAGMSDVDLLVIGRERGRLCRDINHESINGY
jgi:hypothetical protein